MARTKTSGLSSLRALLDSYRKAQSSLVARVAQIGRDIESVEAELRGFEGGRSARKVGRPRRGRGAAKGARKRGRKMASRGGAARSRGAKRLGQGNRAKGQDLASLMAKILGGAGKPMGIPEIAAAAKKRGYRSSSPAFPRIVGMRLSTDKRFKRASFGKYQLSK
jgi:hypothetical protein